MREERRKRIRVRNWGFEFFDERGVAIGADEIGGGGGDEGGAFALVAEVTTEVVGVGDGVDGGVVAGGRHDEERERRERKVN